MLQLLIKNGICVNSDSVFTGDIAISDGKIVQLGQNIRQSSEKTIDVNGKFVFPGIIDAHVHLPWPSSSFDSVDDYHSGSIAAVCGGVTSILEYIVPDESGRIIPALDKQLGEAQKYSYADYSFHLIIRRVTEETVSDITEAHKRGIASFKIYMAYSGFRLSDDDTLKILQTANDIGALICVHAEDGLLVNFATNNLATKGLTSIKHYTQAHPREADLEATYRIITYAKYLNARIHIVHVNTAEGAKMISQAKRDGWAITGETCPQYLLFTEDVYGADQPEAAYFILAPAIRGDNDRESLWKSLALDDLQMIATDHCPYTSRQKTENWKDFRKVPGGAAGIETSLQLIYTYGVKQNRFSIQRMVELMSTNPAKIFRLYPRKGVIAIGSDADFVVYDPNISEVINAENLHSRIDSTIYQGLEVSGKPTMTILRGKVIVENGDLVAKNPGGNVLYRN